MKYLIRIIILLIICDLCALSLKYSLYVPAVVSGSLFMAGTSVEMFISITSVLIRILELPKVMRCSATDRTSHIPKEDGPRL